MPPRLRMERSRQCAEFEGKSPWMMVATFGLWLVTCCALGPSLWQVMQSCEHLHQFLIMVAFQLLLIVFWLLGAYYVCVVIFYFTETKTMNVTDQAECSCRENLPPVAILYPTCDDFQVEAILTCVRQDYPVFHVFILDDSQSENCRESVNDLRNRHPDKITVVRRETRQGFKAGNLNHALRGAAKDYPFFAVMDADERIPPSFLRDMASILLRTNRAFVQANHAPNPAQSGAFAGILKQTILPFWSVFLSTKNKHGFVPCVGHGVLIRRSAWEQVGGLPEVASEDLAFSARLLEEGLRGCFARHVVCYEDFPASLPAFKQQQERYVLGVLQVLLREWPRLLRSAGASWIEKLDFFLCILPLYIPVLSLLFILTAGLGLPLCFSRASIIVTETPVGSIRIPFLQAFDGRFQPMWKPLFVYPSLLFSISPALPMLALALSGKIRKPFRLLVESNVVYLSTMLQLAWSLIGYIRSRRIRFIPTGSLVSSLVSMRSSGAMSPLTFWTFLFSLTTCVLLASSLNLGLAAVALCPLLGLTSSTGGRQLGAMAGIVFTCVLLQLMMGAALCNAPLSIPPLLFSVHF